jgi:hypothetical protein
MAHTLISNLAHASQYKIQRVTPEAILLFLTKMTTVLVERHGSELFPSSRFMRGPVDTFGLEGDEFVVEARSCKLEARYTLEMAIDGLPPAKQAELEEEILNVLVGEIYAEFSAEAKKLAENGEEMYPYILLDAQMLVSADTFEPYIGFITRYGIGPKV